MTVSRSHSFLRYLYKRRKLGRKSRVQRGDLRRIRDAGRLRGHEFGSSRFWTTLSIIYRHGMREAWARWFTPPPSHLLSAFLAGLQAAATPSHLWIISRKPYVLCASATLTPSRSLTREHAYARVHTLLQACALRRRDYVHLSRITPLTCADFRIRNINKIMYIRYTYIGARWVIKLKNFLNIINNPTFI